MIGVILAAGKGSRLGQYTHDLPKSLLPLNDQKTLLDYNLSILKEIGIDKILIVTGFNSQKIEAHVSNNESVEIIYNPFWNNCNVLGSLYMAIDKIDDDFLFLHADTLASIEIWKRLVEHDGDMILPFERKQCGEEEMKISLKDNKINKISKQIESSDAIGEFLGIAKFGKNTIPYFKQVSERLFKNNQLQEYMESVVQHAIDDKKFEIEILDILDAKFVEVDFEEDYLRAKKEFGAE
ncbi:MAG: choline kinase [Psychroserpens sp.]|jgi:choline kinase